MKQRPVGAGTDFIHDVGLKIAVNGSRDIFALSYRDYITSDRVIASLAVSIKGRG
jgi:hypothetical protein